MGLVREIAAYIGQVLVRHAGGSWRPGRTLWGTQIEIVGPVWTMKERPHPAGTTKLTLGNLAGSSWDALLVGVRPHMEDFYKDARRKALRERLGPRARR